MFKQAKLSNYRQHRDLTVDFSQGMNAIRGENEAGKTTLLEAMAYCQFGAQSVLSEPLEDVVTYDHKVGTLKVEVVATFDGVDYLGIRAKSGAEVWIVGADAPLVTGQKECTKWWETQWGVSGKLASSLMLADQAKLRGALDEGASAPVALIQKLANFAVVDTIISLVKAEVPNGRTQLVKDRIERLKGQNLVEPDESPITTAEQVWTAACQEQDRLKAALDAINADITAHEPAAQQAQKDINAYDSAQTARANAAAAVKTARAALEAVVVPPKPDEARLRELRTLQAQALEHDKVVASHSRLVALGSPDPEWEGDLASLTAEMQSHRAGLQAARNAITTASSAIAGAKARLIQDKECTLCGKDLSDVPEVATKNAQQQAIIEQETANLDEAQGLVTQLTEGLEALQQVLDAHQKHEKAYAGVLDPKHILLDRNFVPARWTWTGPDVAGLLTDHTGAIGVIEAAVQAFTRAEGRRQQAQEALTKASAALTAAETHEEQAKVAAEAAAGPQARAVELAESFAGTNQQYTEAVSHKKLVQAAWQSAVTLYGVQREAYDRAQAELKAAEKELADTALGNQLLDKLLSARPIIADRLWKVVLTSVSTYFSSIRGRPSIVTRGADGFEVDGRPVQGLSGSTKDALGLAIRIALTKTFLPNARFMVLDEPAAACSDTREVNMLGLISTADFDQVLLVTHSNLCQSFAERVIEL